MSFINNDLAYSNLLEELTNSPEVTKLKKYINCKFLKDLYLYYIKGGYYNILISKVIDILSIAFVGMFILTTFIFLDWKNIILCGKIPDKNFKDCGEIGNYLSNENIYNPNVFQVLILIFVLGILFSSIYRCVNLYNIFTNFYKVDRYYTEVLKIPRKYLHSKSWEDVISTISTVNNNMSIDDITTIILKEENFFISFIDNNMFGVPNSYFTRQLEYNLYYGLNPSTLVGKDLFYIKNRLILLGILNIIFSPFIFFYTIISFIFYNIDELYNNKKVFGPRRYTPYFKWKIRHYNELEHYFDNRINISMKYANEYTKQFPSIMIENIAKFIAFISGAFIVLFLLFSIFDENILIYVKFLDRSLIFYTGIIGTISAISRSFITEPENSVYDPNAIMNKIAKYTLYYPNVWKDNAHTTVVKNEFLSFYNYILVNFFYEIIGVITTPYFLIFRISKQNNVMVDFLKHNVIFKKNIGNVCLCSDFKNKKTNEKLTSSIMSFSENYPFWKK